MKRFLIWSILLVLLVLAMAVPVVFAGAPTGASPNDPLMVPTGPQTIAPNTTLWFYFDYAIDSGAPGGRFGFGRFGGGGINSSAQARADVAVDTNGVKGITLSIYTPDQASNWVNDPTTQPVGRGTALYDTSNDLLMHDLYWSGGFNTSGRYFVAIANANPTPVSIQLTVEGERVTLYPPTIVATPTLYVPITVTPLPTGNIQGKLVFQNTSGGAIYTVNGDGSNLKQVSHGMDPSWSPDGKQITFARWDNTNPGVFAANADGSNERLIYAAVRARSPRWSPDGRYIAFTQDKSKGDNNIIWKLAVVDLTTGTLIEPKCSQQCQVPSWSNDSTTLYFFDPNFGLMKTSILGGSESVVMGPSGSYWDTNAGYSRPITQMEPIQSEEVSPNGQNVVYAQQAHDRWEVSTVSANGGSATGITSPDLILSLFFNVVDHNVSPTWSPDGKQILFLSTRNGKWEFFVTNADGTGMTQVLKSVTDSIPIQYAYVYERMMDWTP